MYSPNTGNLGNTGGIGSTLSPDGGAGSDDLLNVLLMLMKRANQDVEGAMQEAKSSQAGGQGQQAGGKQGDDTNTAGLKLQQKVGKQSSTDQMSTQTLSKRQESESTIARNMK